jgi:hypothetical protein
MAFRGPSRPGYFGSIIFIVAGLFVFGLSISIVYQGSIRMRGFDVPVTPETHPLQFWGCVGFLVFWASLVTYTSFREIKNLRRRANRKRLRESEPKSE